MVCYVVSSTPFSLYAMSYTTEKRVLIFQVFKGKKMAGRMGGKQRTVKNVWVYKIDPARNLMWVRGQVSFFQYTHKYDTLATL